MDTCTETAHSALQLDAELDSELPEAPVFRPTVEEFRDPMAYMEAIRPVAAAAGICKIIPPAEWRPAWGLEGREDKVRFATKRQDLRLIEATARVRHCVLSALRRFMFKRGTSLPLARLNDGRPELFELLCAVTRAGGIHRP